MILLEPQKLIVLVVNNYCQNKIWFHKSKNIRINNRYRYFLSRNITGMHHSNSMRILLTIILKKYYNLCEISTYQERLFTSRKQTFHPNIMLI